MIVWWITIFSIRLFFFFQYVNRKNARQKPTAPRFDLPIREEVPESTAYHGSYNGLTNGARQSKTLGRGGKGVDPRQPATPRSRDQRKRPKKEAVNCPPAGNRRRKHVKEGRTFRRILRPLARPCFFNMVCCIHSFSFLAKQPLFCSV